MDPTLIELAERIAGETRRHFEIVAEGLRSDVRLVAEGVTALDERFTAFGGEIKADFAELRAMIHLSYAELERRLRALESGQR